MQEQVGQFKTISLSPDQKNQWQQTMALMAWTAPGFRHIFYKLLANNDGEYAAIPTTDTRVKVAGTDGKNILINPETFFKYTLAERVFILAHEIGHNMFNDVNLAHQFRHSGSITCADGSELPFAAKHMQHAMDYRLNALLVESRIGQMPKDALYDPNIATANDGILDVYKKVYIQEEERNGPGKGDGNGDNGSDPDGIFPPGSSTGQNASDASQQRSPQQWAVEMSTAQHLEQARSKGKMPASLLRMFEEMLNPTIPWTEYIKTLVNRHTGTGTYNWKKPDRRFIVRDLYMPGKSSKAAGWIVIWGDTSGSIGPAELNKYLGEISGLIEEVNPERVTVLWCDAAIAHIDDLDDASQLHDIKCRGVGGGGGTSVEPVFDWIAEQRGETPEMFIGFTDGYVNFPDKPPYPVVWASLTEDPAIYPYGEFVHVK